MTINTILLILSALLLLFAVFEGVAVIIKIRNVLRDEKKMAHKKESHV